jgi:hypothetical protein
MGGLIFASALSKSCSGVFLTPASSFEAQEFVRKAKVGVDSILQIADKRSSRQTYSF